MRRAVIVLRHGKRQDSGMDQPLQVNPTLSAEGRDEVSPWVADTLVPVISALARGSIMVRGSRSLDVRLRIRHSPFARTTETAQLMRHVLVEELSRALAESCPALGAAVAVDAAEFRVDDRLCEVFGPLRIKKEGVQFLDDAAVEGLNLELDGSHSTTDEAPTRSDRPKWPETIEQASARFRGAFDSAAASFDNDAVGCALDVILLVTHGDAVAQISNHLGGGTLYECRELGFIVAVSDAAAPFARADGLCRNVAILDDEDADPRAEHLPHDCRLSVEDFASMFRVHASVFGETENPGAPPADAVNDETVSSEEHDSRAVADRPAEVIATPIHDRLSPSFLSDDHSVTFVALDETHHHDIEADVATSPPADAEVAAEPRAPSEQDHVSRPSTSASEPTFDSSPPHRETPVAPQTQLDEHAAEVADASALTPRTIADHVQQQQQRRRSLFTANQPGQTLYERLAVAGAQYQRRVSDNAGSRGRPHPTGSAPVSRTGTDQQARGRSRSAGADRGEQPATGRQSPSVHHPAPWRGIGPRSTSRDPIAQLPAPERSRSPSLRGDAVYSDLYNQALVQRKRMKEQIDAKKKEEEAKLRATLSPRKNAGVSMWFAATPEAKAHAERVLVKALRADPFSAEAEPLLPAFPKRLDKDLLDKRFELLTARKKADHTQLPSSDAELRKCTFRPHINPPPRSASSSDRVAPRPRSSSVEAGERLFAKAVSSRREKEHLAETICQREASRIFKERCEADHQFKERLLRGDRDALRFENEICESLKEEHRDAMKRRDLKIVFRGNVMVGGGLALTSSTVGHEKQSELHAFTWASPIKKSGEPLKLYRGRSPAGSINRSRSPAVTPHQH